MSIKDNYSNVCSNIRYLRRKHGLSRTAMAKKIHITVKNLDSLESGFFPERISIQFFFNIEQAFGISPKTMLTTRLEDDSTGIL